MKTEIELNIDSMGRPCIKFRHHDKDGSLEQRTLGHFIEAAKTHGLVLIHTNGHLESGTVNSWENYEIRLNKQPQR